MSTASIDEINKKHMLKNEVNVSVASLSIELYYLNLISFFLFISWTWSLGITSQPIHYNSNEAFMFQVAWDLILCYDFVSCVFQFFSFINYECELNGETQTELEQSRQCGWNVVRSSIQFVVFTSKIRIIIFILF